MREKKEKHERRNSKWLEKRYRDSKSFGRYNDNRQKMQKDADSRNQCYVQVEISAQHDTKYKWYNLRLRKSVPSGQIFFFQLSHTKKFHEEEI